MKLRKAKIKENLTSLGIYSFEGSLQEVIKDLHEISETYATFDNLRLEYASTYDDEHEYNLYGERLETDSELAKRQKQYDDNKQEEKEAKQHKKELELALYEKLKEKYG